MYQCIDNLTAAQRTFIRAHLRQNFAYGPFIVPPYWVPVALSLAEEGKQGFPWLSIVDTPGRDLIAVWENDAFDRAYAIFFDAVAKDNFNRDGFRTASQQIPHVKTVGDLSDLQKKMIRRAISTARMTGKMVETVSTQQEREAAQGMLGLIVDGIRLINELHLRFGSTKIIWNVHALSSMLRQGVR